MANKDYRKAYESAATELETLSQKKKQIESRILSLRKTMNVLSTLLEEAGDQKWLANNLAALGAVEPSLTDDILAAVNQSTEPMTTTDVLNELRKISRTMGKHKNPLATINAVLKRLEEQGKVEEAEKDGRKAWKPVVSVFSKLFGHAHGQFLEVERPTKTDGPGLMKSFRENRGKLPHEKK